MGNKWSFVYEISEPNEYVVVTGLGIETVKVSRSCIKKPGQISTRIDVSPRNYEFAMTAMSSEKLLFSLPGIFTIGPNVDNSEDFAPGTNSYNNLVKYATFFGTVAQEHQQHTIRGIIEGELRSRCAQLTLEEIFSDRVKFKHTVVDSIQSDLNQFGLKIFNANIRELEDTPGSEYFLYLRQKTRAGAENESKIAIADANNKGAVGQAAKSADTRVITSMITAKANLAENEQKKQILVSNTDLQLKLIETETRIKLQQVQQQQDIEKRNLDLEREVELARQGKRLEELRATIGVDAQIDYEVVHREADAEYYRDTKQSEGSLYEKQREAEGIRVLADARKQALEKYTKVFGNSDALLNYIMLEKGLFSKMATINADAIQGLEPNITVWNTGSNESGTSDPYAPIRNVFTAVPPLISTVQDQTGVMSKSRK